MNQEFLNQIRFDYAQVNDVNLHYATAGTGEKLIVLLHGFPEFWYTWRHQITALSANYTVVAPDMRGYNLSSKPQNISDYEISKLVDDVTGLIRRFGRENAVVVGHDWGAAIAWATAQNHPEYVSKLVTMQVPPPAAWRQNFSFEQFRASWYMFFFQIPRVPEWFLSRNNFAWLERALKGLATRKLFTAEDIADYKSAWNEPEAVKSALNYYRANFSRFFSTKPSKNTPPRKITVPTLFIYGEKDKAVLPATVRNMQQFIEAPYTEFRVPDAGHWVHQEDAAGVNEIMLDFIKSN